MMNSHCQSCEAGDAVEDRHDAAGDRRADRVGDRDRRHEEPDRPRPLAAREPVREIEDHPGEEAGLGDAEQEAHGVEARRPLHERRARRDQAPGDHDARHPLARAEPVQRQVARDLEEEVADEEHARAEAVDGAGEAEVALELVLGERDVDPIQVGDHVEDQQHRDEPCGHLAHGPHVHVGHLLPPLSSARHPETPRWRPPRNVSGASDRRQTGPPYPLVRSATSAEITAWRVLHGP